MKKIEIELYNIDELKDKNIKSFNKVMDSTRDIIIDDRFNFAEYDSKEILANEYNLTVNDVYYSISYCQGDGFCFTMDNVLCYTRLKNNSDDMNAFEKWIINNLSDDELKLLLEYLNYNYNLSIVKDTHSYCHVYTCHIDYEIFYSSDDSKYVDNMNNFIYALTKKLFNNVYVSICGKIQKTLYSYYDVTEDDVLEYIHTNEYYYNIDGELY